MFTRVRHYDVVIIGAGMVGACLALALARSLHSDGKVLLVEAAAIAATSAAEQPGFDARSTVLSAGSKMAFEQLGLWAAVSAAAEPIRQIRVSDQGRFGTVRLDSSSEGVDALGHVVENAALGRALNTALLAAPGLEICAPASVVAIKPVENAMQLQLQQDGAVADISAALVVLAEGGRSGLSTQLGIAHTTSSYGQNAIIANVAFAKAHQQVAYERFTPKGPLALLPLADRDGLHRAALVWTHAAEAADTIATLDDAAFLTLLQQDFGSRVGAFIRVGKRAMFPLALQLAEEQMRPHLALLGNVAHSLHPVAGQGFNLALRDTLALADNIRVSLAHGHNPGTFTRLQAWQQAVKSDQQYTIGFSHYMTRLFSSSSRTLALVRQFGMASIDLLPPLKHQLSRQAMGLGSARVRL